jgi:transmembrane sensor
LSGEAFFDVPKASRPLHLQIDGLRIDSEGTQLDVRRDAAGTQIAVLKGRLRLSCDCTPNEVVLAAGYQLSVDSNNDLARLQPRKITAHERDNLIGWRDGNLRFQGQTLAEVAREFNRYNHRQLVVADAELSNLAIGGTFSANDVESFITGLQKDFGVEAHLADSTGRDKTTVLLSRAAPRQEALPR